MPVPSFHDWLAEHRPQRAPDAGALALALARSGAAGASREEMAKALGVPEETLKVLLRGLVVAGQVVMVSAGGKLVYRAVM